MQIDPGRICLNCMRTRKKQKGPCEFCGYDNAEYRPARNALPPFTPLKGRYLPGRVLLVESNGMIYSALDLETQARVTIREYFPREFCFREHSRFPEIRAEGRLNFDQGRRRFLEEGHILQKLSEDKEQGLLRVIDVFEEYDTAYMVMEYFRGKTLKEYVAEEGGKLSLKQSISLFTPMVRTLGDLHSKKVIWKDIRPENILIDENGTARIQGFGAPGSVQGAAPEEMKRRSGYAAPEQYTAQGRIGPWTDIYAFAVVVSGCLTGKNPEDARNRKAGSRTQFSEDTRIGKKAARVLENAMNPDISKRYQDIRKFWNDLEEASDHKKRNILTIAIVAVFAVAVGGFTANRILHPAVNLKNGTYQIASGLDRSLVLEIPDHYYTSGTSIVLGEKGNANSQKFDIASEGQGTFSFTSVSSDQAVTFVNYKNEPGGDLVQWEFLDKARANQTWTVRKAGNGTYYILNRDGLYVGLDGEKAKAGADVEVLDKSGDSEAFQWYFINTSKNAEDEKTPLTGTVVSVEPSAYRIIPAADQEKNIDLLSSGYSVSDGSDETEAKFMIAQLADKVYGIYSVKSGNAILNQEDYKWKFVFAGGGTYRIVNQSDQALLVEEDNTLDLGPANTEGRGMDTQRWILKKVDLTELEKVTMSITKQHVTLANHENPALLLSTAGNAVEDNTNLILSDPSQTVSQYFVFSPEDDGSYKITNDNSGTNVSLVKGMDRLVRISASDDTHWTLQQAEPGWFYIMNQNGLYLTLNQEDNTVYASEQASTCSEWEINMNVG